MRRRYVVAATAFALAAGAVSLGQAMGAEQQSEPKFRSPVDGAIDTPIEVHAQHEQNAQHGPSEGHVAGSSENVDLVAKLRVHDASEGRISDVWSHGDFAYLGTFVQPDCESSGVYVADISDPENPQEVSFISQDGFVEGSDNARPQDVKAISLRTEAFNGDLLVHTNEQCSFSERGVGGITLWDVSDPRDPEFLSNTGDFDLADILFGAANGVHNVFLWQAGDRAFAALVDDLELDDVDIVEITDPRNPRLIAETGLQDWPDANVNGNGGTVFNHDVWVKKIKNRWFLMSSYWDAGFVVLDVTNPESPVFVEDSDYPDPDPLTGISPPEGNAHAAVWDPSGRFILGGDEDFSPFRIDPFEITTGDNAGEFPAGEFGWTKPVAEFPGDEVAGPTVYGGSGCPGEDLDEDGTDDREQVPPATVLDPQEGEERVVVFTRGTCFFSDKVRSGEEKGYDVAIIGNHHSGAGGGDFPDAHVCGGQGSPVLGTAAGLCIGHRAMHLLFNDEPEFTPVTGITSPDMPPTGTLGERIRAEALFDGWGPLHLLDAGTLEEIDAFAPPEVTDPDFASGFGDLTMHNVETSGNKAYISWYSLGLRVVQFGRQGLEEVGHFIDDDGNNFWGVHVHRDSGDPPLVLASDRDSGLWIFRYTGP